MIRELGLYCITTKSHKLTVSPLMCCKDQLSVGAAQAPGPGAQQAGSCPHTWDGFACFTSTPARHTARVECPAYLYSTDTTGGSP
ncbi:hypothetical protein RRG08_022442 [Elysia crispata]|uniref:G-protein coupled receptors family 2 profile 1 domain-containing protein n=1 Tax=Elysia crispata TaxID=231223 RepID=A0AAE0Z2P5_9GAST|nr:hypothetical protein RRG08_022442 [Elysia crispata]